MVQTQARRQDFGDLGALGFSLLSGGSSLTKIVLVTRDFPSVGVCQDESVPMSVPDPRCRLVSRGIRAEQLSRIVIHLNEDLRCSRAFPGDVAVRADRDV